MRPALGSDQSGFAAQKLALVRLGIGKQIEGLHTLRRRWRSGGGRSPEVIHSLRQGLINTIAEHRLKRRSRGRRRRQLLTGARKSLRYSGRVRRRRDRCRWPRDWRCRCNPHQTLVWYCFDPRSCHRHGGRQWGRASGCGLAGNAMETGTCTTTGACNTALRECDSAGGIKKAS